MTITCNRMCGNPVSGGSRVCDSCKRKAAAIRDLRKPIKVPRVYGSCMVIPAYAALSSKQRDALRSRLHRYKISVKEFFVLVDNQRGRCAICDHFAGAGLCIDHCHTTESVRGLLCNRCNTGLGFFYDNPEYLMLASNYLVRNLADNQLPS